MRSAVRPAVTSSDPNTMLYPVITQARAARESWGKERSRAGKATFTMERSSDAMNAPSAVTTKIAELRASTFAAGLRRDGRRAEDPLTQPTLGDCIPSCNSLAGGRGTEELRRHGLLGGPVPRGRGRVVEHAHRPGRLPGRHPLRRLPAATRDLAQHPPAAPGRLVDAGVLARVPYSEHPPRHDYRLTDKGRDLWPVLTAMRQWGDRYAAPSGPPLEVAHKACGSASEALLVCGSCGEPLGPRDVEARYRRGHHGIEWVPSRRREGLTPSSLAGSVQIRAGWTRGLNSPRTRRVGNPFQQGQSAWTASRRRAERGR